MPLIAAVMKTSVQNRPHPLLAFKLHFSKLNIKRVKNYDHIYDRATTKFQR